MAQRFLTVGFSSHRTESLQPALERMRVHEAVVLEEPENPFFPGMISGDLSIGAYLEEADYAFPLFGRRMCEQLRELRRAGKVILQVEPYLETLAEIHDFFGAGGRPDEIDPGSIQGDVYAAERRWSAALLAYYEISARGAFREVVDAVKRFAGTDAARGRLRDRLRAEGLVSRIEPYRSVYLEAGDLHVGLLRELRLRLESRWQVKPVTLMEPVIRRLSGKPRMFGPGDLLTLLYTFRPAGQGPRRDLLAARSLIQVKLEDKNEMEGTVERPFPHTLDRIRCNRMVRNLSYEDCEALYPRIRFQGSEASRTAVRERLQEQGGPLTTYVDPFPVGS